MATKVIMPKQGLQMIEGTITKWIVKEGEKVELEKPLFEMETDKLNIEIDSPADGTLLKIIRKEGEVVPITEIIAVIGNPGDDISVLLEEADNTDQLPEGGNEEVSGPTPAVERIFATPRAKMTAAQKGINVADIAGTGPDGLIIEKDVIDFNTGTDVPKTELSAEKDKLLSEKAAQKKDINLIAVADTGARGNITRSDVEGAASARMDKAYTSKGKGHIVPFSGMRKVIADRMMQSLHGMAQANHRMRVDMSEITRLREKLKDTGIKVSFTDIIVKIVSRALLDFPIMNSSLTNDGILVKDYVNMGLAVAVENGMIVPVIKDADMMTLEVISATSSGLIEKARKGSLKPDECTGGTFTVTNLGMFDIDEFTAVINPPEAAILAIGKIDRIPVAEGDDIVIKPIMVMSLTYDHRIIDGVPAAQFLQRIKAILQNPYILM